MSRATVGAAGVDVGALVAGGVAVAAIPNSNTGELAACMAKDRTLKMVDRQAGQKCRPGQKLLRWNQVGRRGPAGPSGPSTVYFAEGLDAQRLVGAGASVRLGRFDVRGTYQWNIAVEATATGSGSLRCELWPGGSGRFGGAWAEAEFAGDGDSEYLYLSRVVRADVEPGARVTVDCRATVDLEVSSWEIAGEPVRTRGWPKAPRG